MARVTVVAFVVLILCACLLANDRDVKKTSNEVGRETKRTSVSLPLSPTTSTVVPSVTPVVATVVVRHRG